MIHENFISQARFDMVEITGEKYLHNLSQKFMSEDFEKIVHFYTWNDRVTNTSNYNCTGCPVNVKYKQQRTGNFSPGLT